VIYRQLGRTGLKVSALGFGAMRLPMIGEGTDARVDRALAIPMIHRAFEGGVNYIDTAVGYCNQDSQRTVGEALKGWRDRIIVSTKNPDYGTDEKTWWKNLETSLERLQVQYIDIYNHHGLSWKTWTEAVEPRLSRWMSKARDQGLVRHICCSFHDTNEALKQVIETGYPEVITLQYNLLDRQLEEGIALAHTKGIGIVVMGPVGGGRLGGTSDALQRLLPAVSRVPELALRFVLGNPLVSLALSGMSTMAHVEENLRVASSSESLTREDVTLINEQLNRLKAMADLYCTGCGYCQPCPHEVSISKIFDLYNKGRVYGLWADARRQYRLLGTGPWLPGKQADTCIGCGECEAKCPQRIPIRAQLKEAHAALSPVTSPTAG
jgi:predicted aldo/keto reductase-like oxidoreductase